MKDDQGIKQLSVTLPAGWSKHPQPNRAVIALLVRDVSRAPGRLEVSHEEYEWTGQGAPPLSSPEELQEMACRVGKDLGGKNLIASAGGTCPFGAWGSASFRDGKAYTGHGLEPAPAAYINFWFLNDGRADVLSVAHVCLENPDPLEVAEAQQIVLGLTVCEDLAAKASQDSESTLEGPPRPDAPVGYSWELAGQSRALILRPDGWYFKAFERGDALAYFITREEIPEDAVPGSYHFETGITINVWKETTAARGMTPSAYALAYVQVVNQSADNDTEDTWQQSGGPFISYGVQFSSQTDIGRLRQQHMIIGNDTTDTHYLIIFETPQQHWERDWPIVAKCFEHLQLHPDV